MCVLVFQDFVLPRGVAIPVGGTGRDEYLVLQVHYDNPGLDAGIVIKLAEGGQVKRHSQCKYKVAGTCLLFDSCSY